MMIEPPREFIRGRVLEIHDRVFVTIEQRQIEKISRSMQQTAVVHLRSGVNALLVKAREGCG